MITHLLFELCLTLYFDIQPSPNNYETPSTHIGMYSQISRFDNNFLIEINELSSQKEKKLQDTTELFLELVD